MGESSRDKENHHQGHKTLLIHPPVQAARTAQQCSPCRHTAGAPGPAQRQLGRAGPSTAGQGEDSAPAGEPGRCCRTLFIGKRVQPSLSSFQWGIFPAFQYCRDCQACIPSLFKHWMSFIKQLWQEPVTHAKEMYFCD